MAQLDKFRGCLLGLAVGDALGTTVEFQPRGSFAPLTDMIGGGPFDLAAGQWTDDTSMALCLATSLIKCNGFNALDQMTRYCAWADYGYLSSNGFCFDIGNTTAGALLRFRQTGDPSAGAIDPRSAGNGSLMRLAPVPMFFFPDIQAAERFAAESSRTTHAATECLDACRLLARLLCRALAGASKEEVLLGDSENLRGSKALVEIANGAYRDKSEAEIHGSGYVVACLEAALWCFQRTDNFKDAVLMAANLGDDADTTAAVCGQVAGAYYGMGQIPASWLAKLALQSKITDLAERLYLHST
jgi:ADP-ribosyl-[dinitrogen reductase] hydrolase